MSLRPRPESNPFRPFRPWWQRWMQRGPTRVDRRQRALVTRQLAALINANVPLVRALDCLADHPEPEPIHEVIQQVCSQVQNGEYLSVAMGRHPQAFNSMFCGLVHSGENSGRLHQVLEKLAHDLEVELRLHRKIVSALTYPAILCVAAMCSVAFFLFVILPILEPVFTDTRTALPLPTQILLHLRHLMPWLLAGASILALSGWRLWRRTYRDPKWRLVVHTWLLKIPYFGNLYRDLTVARVIQAQSTMFEVGLSTLQILNISIALCGNARLQQQMAVMRDLVTDGETMSEAMQRTGIFPNAAVQLVSAGEESSQLSSLLRRCGQVMEWDNETALEILPSVLEPLIMLGMGLVVGFIILATLLPIVNLVQGL